MFKRTRLLFILLLVVIMVLAGCSSNSGNNGNNTVQPGNNNETPAGNEGKEQGPLQFSIAIGTNKNPVAENSRDLSKEKYVVELEKRTNTKIDFRLQQSESVRDAMGIMFASGDIPDLVHVQQGMLPLDPSMGGAVEAGVFKPLNDLLNEYGPNLLANVPQDAWEEVMVDGQIYAIPQYLSAPSRRAVVVRADLLEKYDIAIPTTVDEFVDMLRTFKANGHDAPFGARSGFAYSQAIFGAYDVMFGNTMYELVDGEVVPKFADVENMTKALETWKTMQDEGLVAPDWPSHGSSERGKNINGGQSVVWEINGNSVLSNEVNLQTTFPEAKLAIIPSPVGPDGKGGNMLYSSTLRLNYINNKIDDEKAGRIIQFLDWMESDEGKEFFSFGIEGETYTKDADGNIEYIEPETDDERQQAGFLTGWLKLVGDNAFDENKAKATLNGEKILEAIEIMSKEGREGISFAQPLEAYTINPDIVPGFDTAPKVIADALIQMIYGNRPISDYGLVVEEWKQKGGDKVIEEATELWNKQENIFRVGPDANVE